MPGAGIALSHTSRLRRRARRPPAAHRSANLQACSGSSRRRTGAQRKTGPRSSKTSAAPPSGVDAQWPARGELCVRRRRAGVRRRSRSASVVHAHHAASSPAESRAKSATVSAVAPPAAGPPRCGCEEAQLSVRDDPRTTDPERADQREAARDERDLREEDERDREHRAERLRCAHRSRPASRPRAARARERARSKLRSARVRRRRRTSPCGSARSRALPRPRGRTPPDRRMPRPDRDRPCRLASSTWSATSARTRCALRPRTPRALRAAATRSRNSRLMRGPLARRGRSARMRPSPARAPRPPRRVSR